jgi:uncharacterized protein YfaP (DUF2135 family)
MTDLIPKSLYIGNDTASNVYTASSDADGYTILKTITICNTTGASALFDMHILTPSGTPGNNNALFKSFTINSGETVSVDTTTVLNSGYKIYVVNANNKCTFNISGVEYGSTEV